MEGAARSAAVLAGAGERLAAAARRYGRQLGLAFQIVDDILDYQSDQQTFGKPVGHDLDEGKITLPFIRARDSLGPARRARLCALAGEGRISRQAHEEIAALVAEGNGADSARRTAAELTRRARAALNLFPPSAAREQLTDLARHTVTRSN
jgi:octaprenyl-diphosphate synthase